MTDPDEAATITDTETQGAIFPYDVRKRYKLYFNLSPLDSRNSLQRIGDALRDFQQPQGGPPTPSHLTTDNWRLYGQANRLNHHFLFIDIMPRLCITNQHVGLCMPPTRISLLAKFLLLQRSGSTVQFSQ
jgi:hypothetical protein